MAVAAGGLSTHAGAQALTEEYAADVRIEAPTVGPIDWLDIPESAVPGLKPAVASGWGYLRFYGCVTCHHLPDPSGFRRWGPDLDRIGDKTSEDWLDRWLEDPGTVVEGARMPQVPLLEAERKVLAAFLMTQKGDPFVSSIAGNARRGGKLYATLQCASCHPQAGAKRQEGDGPPLADLGSRVRPSWLIPFLMQPASVVANSRMTDYGLTEAQASDLAAYLLGKPEPPPAPTSGKENEAAIGFFVEKGCAGCHRIGDLTRPLSLPDAEGANMFMAYHAQPDSWIDMPDIPDARRAVMAEALVGSGSSDVQGVDAFLESFWETPISEQGWPPAHYDSLATDLSAAACGVCHASQLEDWSSSLHSRSMGPGVAGQLEANPGNAAFAQSCQQCHAPASEQHEMIPDGQGFGANYQHRPSLKSEGLTCAVCHVRSHARLGPLQGNRPPASSWNGPGHGGGAPVAAFEDSRFCSYCHQFQAGGFGLNGKLLQNTYEEWRRSPQADEGQTCQTCHMPDRRHEWRGIHDPETVRKALDVLVTEVGGAPDSVTVEIRLTNRGAAHHLPTYVTPKLMVSARWVWEGGVNQKWDAVRAVGREVILSGSASREVFDTRIPAGGTWIWDFAISRKQQPQAIDVRVKVHPDHFYLGFFESYSRAGLSQTAVANLDSAQRNAGASPFTMYELRTDLRP